MRRQKLSRVKVRELAKPTKPTKPSKKKIADVEIKRESTYREEKQQLRGKLVLGSSAVLLDDKQQCVKYFEGAVPPLSELPPIGRYVYRAGQHRMVSLETRKSKKVVGTRGHCKAYVRTSPEKGIILFHERQMASKTNKVWQQLMKRDLAPEGKLRTVKLDLNINDCKKKWFRKLIGNTPCIIVKHINYPVFMYDLQNDDHCAILYEEKTFATPEELLASKFWSKSVEDMILKYEFMHKVNLSKKHPNFSAEKFVSFCDKINNLLEEEPELSSARPSKMKWGNVLYCLDAKKWYWVDC